ncbi:DUF2069 domain-containing protein [Basilea psittacipulmonis]|uniref:DUF2069 domain-containing protein n=1 Tax=Basilea psittacipulmonis DSM 24701 TaxID=1072685 RepID=A0A077DFG3_9BURK|nr:DUF2069 domain-containing protein [Basilea psittacipulmonis]AIL32896.1 hypothetical protein IX83_05795 [Basilea psittacipulmonis DSM 24701]
MEHHQIKLNPIWRYGCIASIVGLFLLILLWEQWIDPLKTGGTFWWLYAWPLLLTLPGLIKNQNYTFQWTSMLVLFYLMIGVVRLCSDVSDTSRYLAMIQVILSSLAFFTAIVYVRPLKQWAKREKNGR